MKKLGRKLYIYDGDCVVAIEKLVRIKPEEMGLTKEKPTKLVDIVEENGQKFEQEIDEPSLSVWGNDLHWYGTNPEFWITKEEAKLFSEIEENDWSFLEEKENDNQN